MVPKTGKRIAGIAYHFHHNAGKDERAWPFLFGHCWVTLGLIWPTVTRALCFPLRAALYLRAKDCTPADFRGMVSLALDLLAAVRWPVPVNLHVLADGAYATRARSVSSDRLCGGRPRLPWQSPARPSASTFAFSRFACR